MEENKNIIKVLGGTIRFEGNSKYPNKKTVGA
jgi:hypothetical protein